MWVYLARVGVSCSGGGTLLVWVYLARVGVPCSCGCTLLGWVYLTKVESVVAVKARIVREQDAPTCALIYRLIYPFNKKNYSSRHYS